MRRRSSAPEVLQRRTTCSPAFTYRGEAHALPFSIVSYLLVCVVLTKYWQSISPPSPDVCRGVNVTVIDKLPHRFTPSAKDVCYFPFFTFAKAKYPPPALSPRNGRAAHPGGPTEEYVFEAARRTEQGHGDTKEDNAHYTGYPYAREANPNRESEAGSYRNPVDSMYFGEATSDDSNVPVSAEEAQHVEEERAKRLRSFLEMYRRKNSGANNTESTEGPAEGHEVNADTPHATSGKEMFVDRERRNALKGTRLRRIAAAKGQQNYVATVSAYENLDTRTPERVTEGQYSSSQAGANSDDRAEQKEGTRLPGGSPASMRRPALVEQKVAQRLDEVHIEKIRHGIRFTKKFDFDQACDEARKASTVRLMWNIVYTDEYLMAQKLYEKMEAYVLREYIALLKRERELQKIPVVGNQQLMRLVRSLLKREHIKTTKTDAQIGKLFRKVPRLFDWIPSVGPEEKGSGATIRNRSRVDEL